MGCQTRQRSQTHTDPTTTPLSAAIRRHPSPAARNRVLASDGVAVAGCDQFECVPVAEGAVAVKGQLTAARRRVAGRRDLFRVFGELLAKAANEGAQVLTVTAEAGLGKTRFLEEVVYRLRKMGHPVTWFGAECLFHEREVPLSALQAMLRALLAIDDTDADTVVREKARRLRDYGLTPEEMLGAGGLLGVVSAGAGGDPRVARRVLRGALRKIVQGSASGQVSVFAWDGAEHMDAPSRAALHELLQDAATLPVLFVVAGRPGRPWPWHDVAEHHRFTLDPLPTDDLHTLVSLRLGNRAAPAELVAALADRSRANPFYVEEYLKAWTQAGTVVVEGDVVRFVPPPGPETPGTVRGLVASRVSHLSPVERRLLQVTSVFGLRAPIDALAESAELDAVTFRDALDTLVSSGLLAPVDGGEVQFTDALLHDVLYDAITPEMRRVVHRTVGEAQERRAGERIPMLAARIAHHYRQAGDARRADTLLKRAR